MYLGIDIGTSSVKTVLFDRDQKLVGQASESLAVSRPHPGWSEQDPEAWFRWRPAGGGAGFTDAEIDDLIAQRTAARKAKNFAEADRIRGVLSDNGVILEDKPQGTIWRRG